MPRCKRNIVKSGTYHIMVRGVNKQEIFYDEDEVIADNRSAGLSKK